ncbi:MAG: right-handed parallel beta-helix repeat-containing protein [Candidatus Sumerlaeota bacterium]|nr:right-handed parallel beta-helix repeat-containing protein [Candidatus Sumerlaeota bacterium]
MLKRFRFFPLGLLLTLWNLGLPAPAPAQVFVDAAATGTASGASWDNAAVSIQTGIQLAYTSGIAQVWVASGVYRESVVLRSGVLVLGGFAGTETDVGDRDFIANVTIIDVTGLAAGTHRAALMDSTTTAGLDGFTLAGGQAQGAGADGWGGGALMINAGPSNTIANCICTSNIALMGGGLYCDNSSPTLYSCAFTSNIAFSYGAGLALTSASFVMENCSFLNNVATSGGGGLYLEQSDLEFKDCVIADNHTSGMGAGLTALNSRLNLQDSLIQNNDSITSGGGFYFSQSSAVFHQCVITSNSASSRIGGQGGGGWINGAAPLFDGTEISRNSAWMGGGIYCQYVTTPALSFSQCRLTTNTAFNDGGAIYCFATSVTLSDCDVSANNASVAGGMFLQSSIAIATTCAIHANAAARDAGGAFVLGGMAEFNASTFTSNTAQRGGALAGFGVVILGRCTLSDNTASNQGGALYSAFSALRMTDTTLSENRATNNGGAIYCNQSLPSMIRCLIQNNAALSSGGALFAVSSDPVLQDCQILDNTSADIGGGIAYLRSNGQLLDCLIENNTAGDGGGGLALDHSAPLIRNTTVRNNRSALDGGGAWLTGSTPNIQDSSFQLNTAARDGAGLWGAFSDFVFSGGDATGNDAGRDGGGVWLSRSRPSLNNCEISNNSATSDGAGLLFDLSAPTVDLALINGNIAGGSGGGVFCSNSTPAFVATRLTGNYSSGDGGGVASTIDSDPLFDRCLLDANESNGEGGGWFSYDYSFGEAVNSVFFGNHAGLNGGALCAAFNSRALTVNCVIHANTASGWGGGVYCAQGATAICTNTILSRNGQYAVYEATADARVVAGYNLFFGNPDGDFLNFVSGPLNGAVAINLRASGSQRNVQGDPLFVNPAAYDFHVQDGSSALKRGSIADAPAIDFEGDPRPGADGKVDIGVDEEDALNPPPDIVPPVSRVYGLLPVTTTYRFNVPFEATDDESGVQYVQIFVRKDGGPWRQYGATFTTSPVAFDATATGDGLYEFSSIATDNAGNVETKTGPDDQTIVITSYVSPSGIIYVAPNGPGMGASWTQAVGSIRSAIDLAQLSSQQTGIVPVIWVAEGTYNESITMISGLRLLGGFPFGATREFQSDGAAHPTILDAAGAPHAVTIASVASTWIDGFTITGAAATGSGADQSGAGIYCSRADETNTVTRCLITANAAAGFGAGVLCDLFSAPRFEDCRIEGNSSSGGSGAGLACRGFSHPTFLRCSLSDNAGYFGGAIYCEFSWPRFENCVIAHNSAWRGAALYGYYDNYPPFAFCTISNNTALSQGGGFFLLGGSIAYVQASAFTFNNGVAIYEADSDSEAITTRCLFFSNPDGGNPAYMNAPAGDYQLRAVSACIDAIGAADLVGVMDSAEDYAAQPRPVNLRFDDGAFEYSSIVITGGPLIFPDTPVGTASPLQTLTILNSGLLSQNVTLSFDGPTSGDFGLSGPASFTLAPGASTSASIYFLPTRKGNRDAFLVATSPRGGARAELLGYAIGQIPVIVPTTLNFGDIYLLDAPSPAMQVVISNVGYDALVIDQFIFQGLAAVNFHFETSPTLPIVVAAGSSVSLSLVFDPLSVGLKIATLRIHTDDIDNPYLIVTLIGRGTIQTLVVTPPDRLDFGPVPFDLPTTPVQKTLPLVLYNAGNLDLNFTGAGLTLGGADAAWFQFAVSPSTATAIAPGTSRTVDVTFTSSEPLGLKTAWLLITVDDPYHMVTTITLTGEVAMQAMLESSAIREWMRY